MVFVGIAYLMHNPWPQLSWTQYQNMGIICFIDLLSQVYFVRAIVCLLVCLFKRLDLLILSRIVRMVCLWNLCFKACSIFLPWPLFKTMPFGGVVRIYSFLWHFCFQAMVMYGQLKVGGGLYVVLYSSCTVWTAVLCRCLLGKILRKRQWMGVAEVWWETWKEALRHKFWHYVKYSDW